MTEPALPALPAVSPLQFDLKKFTPKAGDVIVVTLKRAHIEDIQPSRVESYMRTVRTEFRKILAEMGLGQEVHALVVIEGVEIDCVSAVDLMTILAPKRVEDANRPS